MLADPSARLFDISSESEIFHEILKESCITPVFKSGDRSLAIIALFPFYQ